MKSTKQINNEQAKELKARKEHSHNRWLARQYTYHKIVERDCYGYSRAKVQNVEGMR